MAPFLSSAQYESMSSIRLIAVRPHPVDYHIWLLAMVPKMNINRTRKQEKVLLKSYGGVITHANKIFMSKFWKQI